MDAPPSPMPPLPAQPKGVPWPTDRWPTGEIPDPVHVEPLLDEVMDPDGQLARTRAVVVVHGGRVVAERYGDRTDAWGEITGDAVTEATPLISWSMAKSMLHAVVGMLVLDGRLSLDDPIHAPEWHPDDPRASITVGDAIAMRDGLAWNEEYSLDHPSDVVAMLYGEGQDDVAGFTARRPLRHDPGSTFCYSSGTSNLVSRHVAHVLGSQPDYEAFLRQRLFDPIGMRSADPRFDAAGTWVGSSYVWATARDFARFGLLYLRDGTWDGQRLLPEGWVDMARAARSVDPDDGRFHSTHWWVVGDDLGTFWASGYEGQSITICPPADLVVVRLGKSTEEQADRLFDWRRRMVDASRPLC